MDFAKPHVLEKGVATKSNICLIKEDGKDGDDTNKLDKMLVRAANSAAIDLMIGHHPELLKDDDMIQTMVDCKNYPERLLCRHNNNNINNNNSNNNNRFIREGDLVVICESFDSLDFVYASRGGIFSNRNGQFHHDDFIDKLPFGCKFRSRNNRGFGFVYLLKPTPELWVKSLNHRTQIVHELDIAYVTCQLQLRPNMIVLEAGTGSGAMSHALCRILAPHGQLHTYDFHKDRVLQARSDFDKNGLSHLITVHHGDVCETGFGLADKGILANAIFLDLPEPWKAIPHAVAAIRSNGRIATYSPCIEQSQRTIEQLKKCGFHSIQTVEVRLREHYVDEVVMELPPCTKWKRPPPSNIHSNNNFITHQINNKSTEQIPPTESNDQQQKSKSIDIVKSNDCDYFTGEDTGAEADNEKSEATEGETTEGDSTWMAEEEEQERPQDIVADPNNNNNINSNNATTSTSRSHHNNKLPLNTDEPLPSTPLTKKRKLTCARPSAVMRGHTAFLTFATAGIKRS